MLGHLVGGHAAVVPGVGRLQEGDAEHRGELVDPAHLDGAARCHLGVILAPLDVDGPIALTHRADDAHALPAGQVLGERERLHLRGDFGVEGGGGRGGTKGGGKKRNYDNNMNKCD